MNMPFLPLTAAQSTIWFDETLTGAGALHTMGEHLDIRGPLDTALLQRAFDHVLTEADALRMRFVEVDGAPVQAAGVIDERLELVDLTGLGDAAHEQARQQMWADLDRPFSLDGGPLVRGTLFTLAPDRHLLYLAMHHLVSDGYSRLPSYDRLAEVYRALADGADPTSGHLPPFRDLLELESAYEQSAAYRRDEAYWREQTAGAFEPVSLSHRGSTRGTAQLRHSRILDVAASSRLRAAAAAADVSWAAFVVAGVGAYVARVTGSARPVLTIPVTGRVGARARRIPGMVANYLPLAVEAGPGSSVGGLLAATGTALLRTAAHQRFRGEKVRRLAGLAVHDHRPFGPFVNVLPQHPELDLGTARATLVNMSTGVVDDFMVTVLDGPGGTVELHVNGNPALYDGWEVRGHADRLQQFLGLLAASGPDTRVADIELLHESDRYRLEAGTGPVAPDPYDGVVERVRRVADAAGDALAVTDDTGRWSYTDLVGASDRVAVACERPRTCALLAEPGRQFVAGVLGVLTAGGTFVPLDVRSPVARVRSLVCDSGANLLLVDRASSALAAEALDGVPEPQRPAVVVLEDVLAGPAPRAARPVVGCAADPAYVLFTSGSTGRPKGAMVHRAGLVNHLLSKQDLLELAPGDCLVQNAPVTFDVSIWQMLSPLIVGATTRVVSPLTAADPDALADVVASDRVTVLEVVPSLLRAAVDLWRGTAPLAGLRALLVTGESLPVDLARTWVDGCPTVPLINAYGPTECSDDVSHAVIGPDTPLGRRAPIGRPIRNTRLFVLGSDLRPVPPGSVGELYVSGWCVGLGYLDDPRRTSTTFVADPFGAPGSRLYRTGDQVRWSESGQLEFVQRIDHQVKVRGQRIELGEIEVALRRLEGVEDAVVVACAGAGGTVLSAHVVGEAAGDPMRLRARLGQVLPTHLIPAQWTPHERLPLTAHGKVDRNALAALSLGGLPAGDPSPADELVSASKGSGPNPPRVLPPVTAGPPVGGIVEASATNPTVSVTAAFAAVLGRDDLGPDDNFFTAGGDSVTAIQVVRALRDIGLRVTPRQIFELGTAGALAAVASQAPGSRAVGAGGRHPAGSR